MNHNRSAARPACPTGRFHPRRVDACSNATHVRQSVPSCFTAPLRQRQRNSCAPRRGRGTRRSSSSSSQQQGKGRVSAGARQQKPPRPRRAPSHRIYERRAARGATRVARAPRPCASALGRDPNPGRALLSVSSSYPNRTTGPSEHYSMPFRLVGLSHNSHCPQAVLGGSN